MQLHFGTSPKCNQLICLVNNLLCKHCKYTKNVMTSQKFCVMVIVVQPQNTKICMCVINMSVCRVKEWPGIVLQWYHGWHPKYTNKQTSHSSWSISFAYSISCWIYSNSLRFKWWLKVGDKDFNCTTPLVFSQHRHTYTT